MTSDNKNRRLVVVAAIAASFLILVFGLTHRVLVARLVVFENKTPIDPATLERFPLQIGGWTGQDVPMDEAIVGAAGTAAHINRRYSRSSGLESVWLYVACGVKANRVLCRRPPACYTALGFSLVDRRSMELPLNDGTKLPCSVFQFFPGGLGTQKVTVLHYLIADGQYFGDISVPLLQAGRGIRAVGYVAQVQIVALTESLTADSSTRLVSAFAVDSALSIAQLFEALKEDRSSGESHESLKGK